MIYREKPCFIIKKNLQKSGTTGVYFSDSVTKQVLKDVCYKILKLNDFEVQYVENDYEDEYMEPTYNKGRLAILHYKDEVNYISFSEAVPSATSACFIVVKSLLICSTTLSRFSSLSS